MFDISSSIPFILRTYRLYLLAGMLVSNPAKYAQRAPDIGLHLRYPISCSKQANITTSWLTQHFEENTMTSVPRSVMFEVRMNVSIL